MTEATILLLDDEPSIVAMLSELLSADGLATDVAMNAHRAAVLVAERAATGSCYRILVTDYRLGRFRGSQVARYARRFMPAIAVVYLSVETGAICDESREIGDAIVAKPPGPEELVALIRRLLARPVAPCIPPELAARAKHHLRSLEKSAPLWEEEDSR